MVTPSSILPDGVEIPVIEQYFGAINAGDFAGAAGLFAEDGVLYAPFSEPIQGPEAIAHYLTTEANGMHLIPTAGQEQPLAGSDRQYELTGQVQTPLFTVNASWLFHLTPQSTIRSVRVTLLASLEQLLPLNRNDSARGFE